ncbi:hypothetical protein BPC006_I0671 [Burkholderia pseudomallei BPC006]|nr:hypothetical protein BPC006_I0671 [Burkholderia pseudomallei BPC006]
MPRGPHCARRELPPARTSIFCSSRSMRFSYARERIARAREPGVEIGERALAHDLRVFVEPVFGDRIEHVAARAARARARRADDGRDPVRGRVADDTREILLRLPAQMLGELRDLRGELRVAVDLHVLHHGRLPALQERGRRIERAAVGGARQRDRHVEPARVVRFDRGEIAVRLHEQHERHGRNFEPGDLAGIGNQTIARPGFTGEQVIDGGGKGLGGKGHRAGNEKPAQAGRLRGLLL